MKLEKAIEILETFRDEGEEDLPLDVEPAINLLIEGGKRILAYRKDPCHHANIPLPSETVERPGEG